MMSYISPINEAHYISYSIRPTFPLQNLTHTLENHSMHDAPVRPFLCSDFADNSTASHYYGSTSVLLYGILQYQGAVKTPIRTL